MIQTWIIHHLMIVGEAAGRIAPETLARTEGIPWPHIVAMRNVLVHESFGVDLEAIWSVVAEDIPTPRPRLQALLRELEVSADS